MLTNASYVAVSETSGRDAPKNCKPVIDQNLIVEGLLFATPVDRCRYLGTSTSEKPRWLEQNKGGYRRLEDVLQESVQVRQSENIGVAPTGPNCEKSSPDIRKDYDDNGNVSLADILREPYSPPDEAASLPLPPVEKNVLNASTQTETPRRATAAAAETTEPNANPPETDRERNASGSRQLKRQKLSGGFPKSGRKWSPELMRLILDTLSETPILCYAAGKAGIHRKTLEYRIKRSQAGDDGYDIEWQDAACRFHEHCEEAIEEAHEKLEGIMIERTFGYDKVLTYRGRVSYKIDRALMALGYEGPDAYLKDESGNPVPETVRKVDTKAIKYLLERWRPETYGKNPKIDAPRQGGVLVVGEAKKKLEYKPAASIRARKWKSWSKKFR